MTEKPGQDSKYVYQVEYLLLELGVMLGVMSAKLGQSLGVSVCLEQIRYVREYVFDTLEAVTHSPAVRVEFNSQDYQMRDELVRFAEEFNAHVFFKYNHEDGESYREYSPGIMYIVPTENTLAE